jgi:hypothetical protein
MKEKRPRNRNGGKCEVVWGDEKVKRGKEGV